MQSDSLWGILRSNSSQTVLLTDQMPVAVNCIQKEQCLQNAMVFSHRQLVILKSNGIRDLHKKCVRVATTHNMCQNANSHNLPAVVLPPFGKPRYADGRSSPPTTWMGIHASPARRHSPPAANSLEVSA